MPTPRVRTVMINVEDRDRLVAFWRGLLEVPVREADEGGGIVWLEPDTPGGVNVGLQQVAQKLGRHTEVHLDIAVDDLDATQRRIEALGGSLVRRNQLPSGFEWRVCADPEGNEFCIFAE